jgi:hypothetical protein
LSALVVAQRSVNRYEAGKRRAAGGSAATGKVMDPLGLEPWLLSGPAD